jgi:hypothetical protein
VKLSKRKGVKSYYWTIKALAPEKDRRRHGKSLSNYGIALFVFSKVGAPG